MNNKGGQVLIRILCILFGILINSIIIHLILLSSVYCAALIKECIAYLYFWATNVVTPILLSQRIGCRGFHWSEILQVLIITLLVGCSIVIINAHLILLFCITIMRIRKDMNQFYRMIN